jgi:hypothetical protein
MKIAVINLPIDLSAALRMVNAEDRCEEAGGQKEHPLAEGTLWRGMKGARSSVAKGSGVAASIATRPFSLCRVWVGFTAATGSQWQQHDILSWYWNETASKI